MKLTMDQVEARLVVTGGREVFVMPSAVVWCGEAGMVIRAERSEAVDRFPGGRLLCRCAPRNDNGWRISAGEQQRSQ